MTLTAIATQEDYTVHGSLRPAAPFDFNKTLGFLDMFTPMQREQTQHQQILTKAVVLNGQTIAFSLRSTGPVEAPQIDYTLHSKMPITDAVHEAVVDRIKFFLSLDDDLQHFYKLAQNDTHFAPIVQHFYGLHHVKFLTPFENAAWAVLGQRIPMKVAQKIKHTLMEQYGGSIEIDNVLYRAFPEAHTLAKLDFNTLQAIVQNERKTSYLLEVARAFASVSEDFLRHSPIAEIEQWLLNIKGIGAWSSTFILIRGLGRMEHLPEEGSRLQGVVDQVYGKGYTVAALKAHYGAWKGYWAYYLRVIGEGRVGEPE